MSAPGPLPPPPPDPHDPRSRDDVLKVLFGSLALVMGLSVALALAIVVAVWRAIPRPQPLPSRVTLEAALPPGDAADAVRAYRARHRSLWEGDWDGVADQAARGFGMGGGGRLFMKGAVRFLLPAMRAFSPREVAITSVTVSGELAEIRAEGRILGKPSRGVIRMARRRGGWVTVSSSWSAGTN